MLPEHVFFVPGISWGDRLVDALSLPDLEAACAARITVAEALHPNSATVQRYAQGYAGYRRVYPALKGIRG
jgi:xylulokinase